MGEPRYYKAHKDNCMQCCLCYLLDVDLDQVFDVSKLPEKMQPHWFQFLNEYLHTNYEKVLVPMAEGHELAGNSIALKQGLNGKDTHAVVIDKDGATIWDPNPEAPIYGETIRRLLLL